MVVPLAHQHDAHGPASEEHLRRLVQPVGADPGEQHVVAAAGQRVGHAADEAQKERVGQMLPRLRVKRHDHRHRVVVPQPQVLGANVDAVVERARQLGNARPRLGIHQSAGAERTRHGGHRDAGQPRDVGHLHP